MRLHVFEIFGEWLVQANKHTDACCSEVTLVWDSHRLVPIKIWARHKCYHMTALFSYVTTRFYSCLWQSSTLCFGVGNSTVYCGTYLG